MTRRNAFRVLFLSTLLVVPGSIYAAGETRDPAAVTVAKRTLDAMGGEKAFGAVRTLTYDFVVDRDGKEVARYHHVWDRWDGRYRVEGKNREGKPFLTIFNVQQHGAGRAWLDGKELSGDDLKKALERGYARFINDSYWLLMPSKMMDPGVSLASEGEQTRDGKTYDVVRLTFADGIGLTPKDTYWAYVSKESGLMERWEMVLTGEQSKDRSGYDWTEWKDVGGIRLAMKKAGEGGAVIRFDNVSASPAANDAAFTTP